GPGYSTHKTTIKDVGDDGKTVTLSDEAAEAVDGVSVACGTDCLSAFNACQSAMSASLAGDQQRSGMFFVPPLESSQDLYYFLSDDFEVLCPARYEGVGTAADRSGSRILFAPGNGFRIRGFGTGSIIGDASNCVIAGFDI